MRRGTLRCAPASLLFFQSCEPFQRVALSAAKGACVDAWLLRCAQDDYGAVTMRFPSLALLAERAAEVLRRFPCTLAAGGLAAAAAIVATTKGAGEVWARLA